MGNAMGKKRKMGISGSSKRFGGEVHNKKDGLSPLGRSYSMPVHHAKSKSDNYHVVALTSSTYGILKVDAPKDLDEARTPMGRNRSKDGGGIEGLEQLKNLDVSAGVAMQWSEVEEMMHKLKPIKEVETKETDKETPVFAKEEVLGEPETIYMWELMEGLEEDARSPSPLKASPLSLQPVYAKRARGLETSVSFSAGHSVTEVDAAVLKAALQAEGCENPWRGPYPVENTAQGRIHPGNSAPRLGSGKENAEPANTCRSESVTPLKSNSVSVTSAQGPPPRPNPGKGVAAIVNALNSKAGIATVPGSQLRNSLGGYVTTSDASAGPVSPPVPSISLGVPPESAVSKTPALQKSRPEDVHTSPSFFTTSSPADASDDRVPAGSPLFDPELLASIEKAFYEEVSKDDWYVVRPSDAEAASTSGSSSDGDSPSRAATYSKSVTVLEASPLARNPESDSNSRKMLSAKVAPVDFEEKKSARRVHPLMMFEKKCPPGGEGRVVLYFTSLRGIRKTFEDCSNLRMIIKGFNVAIDERDVSMHAEFREELKATLGKMMPVPRVFIKGHYIGGAEEVSQLHEDGILVDLLEGLPHKAAWEQCEGCGGVRFVPCSECSGSCKVITEDDQVARCTECNENGLMRCPICY